MSVFVSASIFASVSVSLCVNMLLNEIEAYLNPTCISDLENISKFMSFLTFKVDTKILA